jgi:small subunit ribosomal protein S17
MFKKDTQKNKEETQEQSAGNGKVLSGVVSSDKMTDTIVVNVNRYNKHPKYGKFINTRKKYKAHDAGNTAKVGDTVKIVETAPISKDKRFRLLEITAAATVVDLGDDVESDKDADKKDK